MSLKAKNYNLAASDLVFKDGAFPVRHCVENADRLMSGEMVVDTWVEGDVSFSSLRIFDWGGEYSETPTTFQLYLQGMQPISYLASAYSVTGDKRYVELALSLYKSWRRYEGSSASSKNEYVWDQHASAMRAENLLALLLVATEGGAMPLRARYSLQRELLRHGRYLSDDSNYLEGENHGAFQDRALLYLGIAFDCEPWRDKAKVRLERQWKALFDDDMACRENSFTYQRVNKDLFLAVARVLRMKGDAYGDELAGKIALAEDFMGYALLPDGYCPAFGDTFKFDYSSCPYLDDAGVLAYSSRRGTLGKPPAELCKTYRDAGYFFGREHWGGVEGSDSPRCFENAVWTMFRSGYGSITHRQADDNSFMLYARGKEVFTDAGVYNYMYKHPIRRYVRSAYAHNTIVVDGASYDFLRRDNVGLSGFCHVLPLENGGYYVAGYNSLFFGVVHIRHFIYWATALVIVDELYSSSSHVYTQQFHCAPDVEVEDASVGITTIGIPGPCGSKVALEQIEGCDEIALHRYDGSDKSLDEAVPYGVIGGEFNEVLYTTTLTYSKTGKNVRFVTPIFVDDGACDRLECAFDSGRGCVVLSRGDDELEVQLWRGDPANYAPSPKYKMDCVSIHQAGSRFEFEYDDKLPDCVELAWYVCGNHGKKVLFKSVYSQSLKFSFDFSQIEDRNCAVRLFVHDRRLKSKATQMVARITNDGDGWTWSYWPDWDETWRDWFGGTVVPARDASAPSEVRGN